MHINLKKAGYIENYKQCFALWINDETKGETAFSLCCELIDFFTEEKEKIKKAGITNFTPFLTVENASVLMGDKDNISYFKNRGVIMMTLTWNGENEVGYGVECDNKGLKDFGKTAVKVMEKEGVTVDVSHLNEAGFKDVLNIASKPFVASHSGSYGIVPHKRNLKNWQIKEIINSGGLIGVPFCEKFTRNGKIGVYRHLCRILSLGGENNVSLGSDFDGCKVSDSLSGIEKMGELYNFLCESDIGTALTKKIFYLNAEKFFKGKY